MKLIKDNRIFFFMIISLTLVSIQISDIMHFTLRERLQEGKSANILLIGTDPLADEEQGRSDVLILASINKEYNKVLLISIPRDTRIEYQGGSRKINMVNQYEGPEAACREVAKLLDIEVRHYILTHFSGFESIIDLLGGVWLDVDIDLHSYSSGIHLEKGYQHLNGKEALKYVRFRSTSNGDIGRTERQQRFLKAILQQVHRKETVYKLPELIGELQENVKTNVPLNDMLYLCKLGLKINENNIITQTLPGYHYIDPYSGASFWELDTDIAHSIVESLYRGHRYEVYQECPQWRKQ